MCFGSGVWGLNNLNCFLVASQQSSDVIICAAEVSAVNC